MERGYIEFAKFDDDVIVVRVNGRGNHEISPQVTMIRDRYNTPDRSPRYIFDLEKCPTMDSTFMGVIASLALRQLSNHKGKLVVLNADETTQTQLEKLGLKYVLELRNSVEAMPCDDFEVLPETKQEKLGRIVHMIECHQALIDADSGNEVKFRAVLQSLGESLSKEQGMNEPRKE